MSSKSCSRKGPCDCVCMACNGEELKLHHQRLDSTSLGVSLRPLSDTVSFPTRYVVMMTGTFGLPASVVVASLEYCFVLSALDIPPTSL